MPEGHVIHRQAGQFAREAGGLTLHATSPQGRFAQGAAVLDGRRLVAAQAHGKHLFLGFSDAARDTPADGAPDDAVLWLHVHLGLYGKWWWHKAPGRPDSRPGAVANDDLAGPLAPPGTDPQDVAGASDPPAPAPPAPAPTAPAPTPTGPTSPAAPSWQPPEPRPTARVRLETEDWSAELTGPTRCELLTAGEKAEIEARLGPDPLRADHVESGAKAMSDAIRSRRTAVGELLMDQRVVAGVGNIYRAEVLFRARQDPYTPGREVSARTAHAMWRDLVGLLEDGRERGAIVTTRPADRPHGEEVGELAPAAERASEWEADQRFYVYKRTGRACHRCGGVVAAADAAGRTIYWCPRCQRPRR